MLTGCVVALRKESVDRNLQKLAEAIKPSVALRKESVDRNYCRGYSCNTCYRSLSARRAWIEIWSAVLTELLILVALRKESVDRNMVCASVCFVCVGSLSARRAWIEIQVEHQ